MFTHIRRLAIRAQKAQPNPDFILVYPEVVARQTIWKPDSL
jgi:hypothetical protein